MALFNFPSGGQTAAGKGSIREDRMGNINIVYNAYALENWQDSGKKKEEIFLQIKTQKTLVVEEKEVA